MRLFFLSLSGLLLFTACGTGQAEKIADEFHQKLDEGNFNYIVDELCDEELLSLEGKEGMMTFLEQVSSWGPIVNREKKTGFSTKTGGSGTMVKFDYTFDNDMGHYYEGIVLIDRGEGFHVLTVIMNQDEEVVKEALKDF